MEREAAAVDLETLSREGRLPCCFGRSRKRKPTATTTPRQGAQSKLAQNTHHQTAYAPPGGRSKRVKKEKQKQERARAFNTAQAVKLAALFPGSLPAAAAVAATTTNNNTNTTAAAAAAAAATAAAAAVAETSSNIVALGATCTASPGPPTSSAGSSAGSSGSVPTRREKKNRFRYGIVAAPMVGASDLAFRLLCRRHGVQLCYSEMLHSDRLAEPDTGEDYLRKCVLDIHISWCSSLLSFLASALFRRADFGFCRCTYF